MKLNEKLHLVIPIFDDSGDTIKAYAHSAPISQEVFEANVLLVSKTYATILGERLGELAGPRVAAMMLRKVAADRNDTGSYLALTNEINRLTNVIAKSPDGGWIPLPFNVAKAQGIFDPEDLSEVENAIVFFTVASAMLRKAARHAILPGAASLWGAQISALNSTAFAASLPISTATVSTGATIPASAVPF